jgi:hypothetical protein
MQARRWLLGFMAVLALALALTLGPGFTGAAKAASEDVAMFYDDLSQLGQWVEYGKYGPVWRPTGVAEDWRPYTNGRWVPTNDGNVFESEEPWAWATYHYGNWMPTENDGWVWVPGRTWYPSTVEWRTSPESEPVESSYVGWAPTPPPNYEPPPAYAPASYNQGSPLGDSLASPLWVFAQAAQFLLGFGQPYTPAYSYLSSGVLVPPAYVPVFYPQTMYYQAYATPTYYPPAFFGGRRFGPGYYNQGPGAVYITRVTNINQTVINQTIVRNSTNITRIHNVVPPRGVMDRHGYIRQIVPPSLAQGRSLPPSRPVKDFRKAQANLNKPNVVPEPRNVPRVTAKIPQFQPGAAQTGGGRGITTLPAKATMPMTPHMTQQIQKLPHQQPGKAATATQPGSGQPGSPLQEGQAGGTGKHGQGQAIVPGQPGKGQPATGPTGKGKPQEFHPGVRPSGTPTGPGATKPSGVPLPPGHQGLTPEQRRQQEKEHQKLQQGGAAGQSQQEQQLKKGQQQQQGQQLHQKEQQLQQQKHQQLQQEQQLKKQQQQQQLQQRQKEQQVQQQKHQHQLQQEQQLKKQQQQQQLQQRQKEQQAQQLKRQQQLQQEQQLKKQQQQQQLQQRQQQVQQQRQQQIQQQQQRQQQQQQLQQRQQQIQQQQQQKQQIQQQQQQKQQQQKQQQQKQ